MDPVAQRVFDRFARDGAVHVHVQSTSQEDGKTTIKVTGDMSSDASAKEAVSKLGPAVRTLVTQAERAKDGDEYPVELELDLLGVTAISGEGVWVILGVLRHLHPYMPHLVTNVTIKAKRRPVGGVANALATLGRLNSSEAREFGIHLQAT